MRARRRCALGLAALLAAAVLVALPAVRPGNSTAAAASPPGATNSSYAIVDAAGGVMTFGGAAYDGDTLEIPLTKPIVGGAADPNGGYWLVASDGGIFSFGNAQFFGSTGGIALNKPIVGMAATPDGGGYWLVASDGGIFSFGDAQFYGSTGGIALNKPIVGMAAAAHGRGYWLVASDGGIFSFGTAPFLGSTGGIHLNQPVVGMAATSDGGGYWLVATDGGIFTYGDATFWGSAGGIHLSEPIVAMTPTPDGNGYWLVGQDAGVFTYGDAAFSGSAQSPLHPPYFPQPLSNPIPAVVTIINEGTGPQATHQGMQRVAFSGDSLSLYEGELRGADRPALRRRQRGGGRLRLHRRCADHPVEQPALALHQPGGLRAVGDAAAVGRLALPSRRHRDSDWLLGDAGPPVQRRLHDAGQPRLRRLHSGQPGPGGADRPLRRGRGHPVDVALLRRRDAEQLSSTTTTRLCSRSPRQYPYVSIDDLFTVLDPGGAYSTVVDGLVARGPDGVHITQAGVDTLIEPALNQIIANVAGAVYAGGA